MRSLPSGTVTFLFTDIEGSTRLLHELGDAYADVLAEHQRLLRAAFERHGGHEVDTQGDAFFVAFDSARRAVAAAADAQRVLAAHEWPGGAQVRVRVGVHSGDPITTGGGYTGMGVHRAARIGAVGHGGQVLISNATRELVKDDLPKGVGLRDLGRTHLKDLHEPERIHQLVIDGLKNDFPPLRVPKPPIYRRPLVVLGALPAVAAAAAALALLTGGSTRVTVAPNSLASIDPTTNKVDGQVPVGAGPGSIAYEGGSLWVANVDDQTITRVDPRKKIALRSITAPEVPTMLAVAGRAVWMGGRAAGQDHGVVRRIDPQFNSLGAALKLPSLVPGEDVAVASTGQRLFAAVRSGDLTELDPTDGHVLKRIETNADMNSVAASANGTTWIPESDSNTVLRVDPSGLITPIPVGRTPLAATVAGNAVWVTDIGDDAVVRINPETNAVMTSVRVGRGPVDLTSGAGSIWVASVDAGTVTRIDAATGRVLKVIELGESPDGVRFANGRLWVAVARRVPPPRISTANTLRATTEFGFPTDPALPYSAVPWQILYETCVNLLSYPDRAGAGGARLVPEVAAAYPRISKDGRTYTFKIRDGFRFSPPSNQPVTAATFKYAIERALSPRTHGPYPGLLNSIAGEKAFLKGKVKHISGIVASGDRLTIRLAAPTPDLLARLALPFSCAVPIGTPIDARGVDDVPMAGPYYFKSDNPTIVLERNPNYHGARPRQFKHISVAPDIPGDRAVRQVLAGKTDVILDGVPPEQAPALKAKYGHAQKGVRLVSIPTMSLSYLMMNTTRPLFRDGRLRQAINYAVDRTRLSVLGEPNGQRRRVPSDEYLPPGIPGYIPAKLFPLRADVARARALAGHKHRTAVFYGCAEPGCAEIAQELKTELAKINIDIQVKTFGMDQYFARIGRRSEPYDLAFGGWLADYPDPADFLDLLLAHGWDQHLGPTLSDARFLRKLEAAAKLTGTRRYLTYGTLANQIATRSAPWAAIGTGEVDNLLSARVGCPLGQAVYGLDLGALCART